MAAEQAGTILSLDEETAILFPENYEYEITSDTTWRGMNSDIMAALQEYLDGLVDEFPEDDEDEDDDNREEVSTQLDSEVVFVANDEQYVKTRNRKVLEDVGAGSTIWLRLIKPEDREQKGKHRGIKNALKKWINKKLKRRKNKRKKSGQNRSNSNITQPPSRSNSNLTSQ